LNSLIIFLITLKNIIYGFSVYFTGSLAENTDILDILALRFLMSTIALYLLKTFKAIKIDVGLKNIVCKKHLKVGAVGLLLTGLFEPILYMFFETLGISMTTGITAGVILALAPIFSCLSEWIFLKEKNTLAQKIFLCIGIAGVIYIAANTDYTDGKDSTLGIFFMLLAVICGVLYSTFARKSSKLFSGFEITYISCLEGTIIFNIINVVRHLINGDISTYFSPFCDLHNIIGFLYLSIISTIVATTMNNYALSKAQISSLAAFGGISTMVTIFADVFFNNTTLYFYQIIGICLIMIRIIGVTVIDIKNSKSN